MRVAVLGAGLAGLSAAWWLARRHEVTLIERHARPGFTAASLSVPGRDGAVERVDVPLRVFYAGYYPTLTRLYAALGVDSEAVSYAASFRDAGARPYFRYRNLRLGRLAIGLPGARELLPGSRAWRIVGGLLRFRREAVAALRRGALDGLTIGEYVATQAYAADFVDGFLLPTICTVCTCTVADARRFPASVIVDYVARGVSSESVRRALHGADGVEAALLRGLPAPPQCGVAVTEVRRDGDGVTLRFADGRLTRHDHVVLATQAHHSAALLADADAAEQRVLRAFRYSRVQVTTHGDERLMPADRRDWRPVNLRLDSAHAAPESTIWVNAVQPSLAGAADVFQTVQPQRPPRADRVFGEASFERPLVDADSEAALAALPRLHAESGRRVWFCGAWAQAGIPLLESAVRSAQAVAARLGVDVDGAATQPGRRAANSA